MDNVHQLRVACLRFVNQQHRRVDYFGSIMRRDACRHADRNAARAIGQQVREEARHDFRLFIFAVIRGPKIGRIFIEPVHEFDCRTCQPRLSISVGCGIITINIAEIALPVDQRITKRKSLREAHHRVVH